MKTPAEMVQSLSEPEANLYEGIGGHVPLGANRNTIAKLIDTGWLAVLRGSELAVLIYLIHHASNEAWQVSTQGIADALQRDNRSVRPALRWLIDHGLVEQVAEGRGCIPGSYRVNELPAVAQEMRGAA